MKRLLVILIFLTLSLVYSQTNPINRELEYYPLSTGNYFEYKSFSWEWPYYSDSSAYSIKVLGDTLLENGKRYKILLTKDIPIKSSVSYTYERIDSLTGSVYRYRKSNSYNYFQGDEYMMDSIFAQSGDTIGCSRNGFSSFGYFRTICMSTHLDTLLGFPTEVKEFRDQSFIPGLGYKLAKGLGFFSSSACEFSCSATSLVYAEINGNIYGKTITSVDKTEPSIPLNFKLYQNYPNPFNPQTKITFEIPERSFVELKIYDLKGAKIQTLFKKEYLPGIYSFDFDGSSLSSGIYFYQLVTSKSLQTKKMLLIK